MMDFVLKMMIFILKLTQHAGEGARFSNLEMMNYVARMMNVLFKTMNFLFKTMNFVFKTMNFVFKTMDFVKAGSGV